MDVSLLPPGTRLAVGLSGGADSVALVRILAAGAGELGLAVHAAHLNHGLRGEESDRDQRFCAELAEALKVPFFCHRVDTAKEVSESGETIEAAARRLRYAWFRELMQTHRLDAVGTAHTLDDQAETVLGKFLRGAWTEGLSGIFPVVDFPEGRVIRPFLPVSRPQIEAYLKGLDQGWCEDSSNRDPAYTRNRIRHELLPELERWNPQIRNHLVQMAEIAREEEEYWQAETARLAEQLLLAGRPVRGGGRSNASHSSVAIDVVRLAALAVPLQRRVLRFAANRFEISLDYEATESLRELAVSGRSGQKLTLPGRLCAERTPRELRLSLCGSGDVVSSPVLALPVPGEVEGFGWSFRTAAESEAPPATVRSWRSGDRVTLRYSSGPRKVKEVLERLKVGGEERAAWPVIEWKGQIVWMQGVEVQPVPGIQIAAERL